jgi:PhnB protein
MSDSIVPYLCCDGASKAIAYYVTVFGPTRSSAGPAPDRRIGHAEVRIAGHSVYLADEHPRWGAQPTHPRRPVGVDGGDRA